MIEKELLENDKIWIEKEGKTTLKDFYKVLHIEEEIFKRGMHVLILKCFKYKTQTRKRFDF